MTDIAATAAMLLAVRQGAPRLENLGAHAPGNEAEAWAVQQAVPMPKMSMNRQKIFQPRRKGCKKSSRKPIEASDRLVASTKPLPPWPMTNRPALTA